MRCLVPVFDSDFPSLDPMDCKVESIRGTVTPAHDRGFWKGGKAEAKKYLCREEESEATVERKAERSILFNIFYKIGFCFLS